MYSVLIGGGDSFKQLERFHFVSTAILKLHLKKYHARTLGIIITKEHAVHLIFFNGSLILANE